MPTKLTLCSIQDCDSPSKTRGWCNKHYLRWQATGDPLLTVNHHHGLARTPTYACWAAMLQRCHNPHSRMYPHYGGRGITVCKRWRANFLDFLTDMGERPQGSHASGRAEWTLERIDNDKGYEPVNCRWATSKEQANNRRIAPRNDITGRFRAAVQ